MKFLIVLPDTNYYLWQMLLQINNFRKLDYEQNAIYVIGTRNSQQNPILTNIIQNGGLKCSFHVYRDERQDLTYPPSMTAHVLKKFMADNKNHEPYFYLDPDVIFIKKINFSNLLKNNVWYMSDTRSYLGVDYIKNKSELLFNEMCSIVGINPEIVEENDKNAGGAQILLKNTNYDFWNKVETDSLLLYKHMVNTKDKYSPKFPIQSWTAEMWSLLWNSWLFNHETKIIKSFNFCWATDIIKKYDEVNIYHNAGAVINNGDHFLKSNYLDSPFRKEIKCKKKYCSYNYLQEIKDTEKNFNNIIF